jgi:hypothetical protein
VRIEGAKQEAPTAHVAPTDELGWEKKLLRKGGEQHIYVFGCGDAAEQNRLAPRAKRLRKRPGVLLEGPAKLYCRSVDIGLCELRQVIQRQPGRGRQKPPVRRDHEHSRI